MNEAEIPLDLSFVFELAKPPSLEEELQLRERDTNHQSLPMILKVVKRYAEDISKTQSPTDYFYI